MDLEINILNEIIMREKDKYQMISRKWRILKNDRTELTYKTETDSQTYKTKLWLQQATAGINLEFGINSYALAYI